MDPYEYISSASKTLDRSEDYSRHTLEFRTPSFGKKVQSQSVDAILQVAKECLEREIATFELECVLEGKNTVWITLSNSSRETRIIPDRDMTANNVRELTNMDPYTFLNGACAPTSTQIPIGNLRFSSSNSRKKITLEQVADGSKILNVAKFHLRNSLLETYSGDCVFTLVNGSDTGNMLWVTVEGKSKTEIAFTRRIFNESDMSSII